MDAKKRIEQLSQELLRHQYLYYVKTQPEISDREYDRLFDELVELEKKYPGYAPENSPTKRIGSDLNNKFPEKEHTIPVLSLDKEYTVEGLEKWLTKTITNANQPLGFVVEEKIDGASIVLYYKTGKLDTALTRGNGVVGNDVAENIRTIKQIPLITHETADFAVRTRIWGQARRAPGQKSPGRAPFSDQFIIVPLVLLIKGINRIIIKKMDKKIFLKELKDLLVARFREDIRDVVLFGSRAIGKEHKDSDFDVLIVLNRDYDWQYEDKMISVLYEMELEYDTFIDSKIISVNELENTIKGKEPLYVEAIQVGIHA
jgi:predicted nucleotidyltransferase